MKHFVWVNISGCRFNFFCSIFSSEAPRVKYSLNPKLDLPLTSLYRMGEGGPFRPPYVKSVLVKSYTWNTWYLPNFSSPIEWRYFHDRQRHVGGPGGRFEGHPDGDQQERFFFLIQECGTCFIPNFSSPIEGKHSYDHQTYVEGPGGQCEGHLGGFSARNNFGWII